MFNKVLYVSVLSVFVFLVVGLVLPSKVHVERQVVIDRQVSTVFLLLNGFDSFQEWSPWAVKDPDAVIEYSGPQTGVGARMDWTGDPRLIGNGWQEITESRPYSLIRMHMDLEQQGVAETYFQIDRVAGGSQVTWGFDADLVAGQGLFGGIMARYFGLFFDKWIGTDYEQGLQRLKSHAEALVSDDFQGPDIGVVQTEAMDILFVASGAGPGFVDITASLAAAYQEISAFMSENGIEMYAQPMTITRAWDGQDIEFLAAIPVVWPDDVPANTLLSGHVQAGKSPSGSAARIIHRGPLDRMGPSYEKLAAYMAAHNLKEGRVSWEHYVSNPRETPQDALITHIYFLIDDAVGTGDP